MVLSACALVFMTTEASKKETTEALTNSYTVLRNDSSDSHAQRLGQSLVNAFVIVAVITVMTFGIVLLYKYRCMKCLIGYMMVASLVLLATLSARMVDIAVERYQFAVDYITFSFVLFNFAAVGTYSIFFAQGVPRYITQAYLVATSVLVAWELAHFDEYTGWALLVMLALYDLYAVLTPYGPLKALVKLMQAENAPPVPGLLYEAQVGPQSNGNSNHNSRSSNSTNQRRRNVSHESNSSSAPSLNDEVSLPRDSEVPSGTNPTPASAESFSTGSGNDSTRSHVGGDNTQLPTPTMEDENNGQLDSIIVSNEAFLSSETARTSVPVDVDLVTEVEVQPNFQHHPRLSIPMALAKLYRLPLENDPHPLWLRPRSADMPAPTYTVEQLTSLVVAIAPTNGGTIRPHPEQVDGQEIRYQVLDATGECRRVLFVNASNGRVFEVRNYEEALEAGRRASSDGSKRENIRLGLGDFIFYSVLVSKAALHSWTTFCAATLSILCGLGLTLLLLAWQAKALPALPISIFLGVSFYLSTRYLLQPWIEEVFQQTIYV